MKFLIAFVLFSLVSANSFASGKLQFTPEFDTTTQKTAASGGLSIYEKLGPGLYLNSFTGAGQTKYQWHDDVTWFTQKAYLELPLFNWFLTVGLGGEVSYVQPWDEVHSSLLAKVAVKLW